MSTNKNWDVIVVGGGMSGFVAATAAARNGSKTLLIERDGSLGGTMATNLVGPMMTFHSIDKQMIKGMAQEVVDRLIALGASPGHIVDNTGYVATVTPFENEALKLVAQRIVLESGAEILLDTWVQDVIMEENTIRGVTVFHKGGRENLYGRVVIDASGDGDVAFRSGAPYEMGRNEDKRVQPVSLMFRVGPIDMKLLKDYILAHPEEFRLNEDGIKALSTQEHIAVNGLIEKLQSYIKKEDLPIRRETVLFFSTGQANEIIINMSRIADINPLDAWSLTKAELLGREQMFALVQFLQKVVPGFGNIHLLAAGARVGVRESRRIMGEYVLTEEDVLGGKHFKDAVMRNSYPIDVHPPSPEEPQFDGFLKSGEYYEIPYRCLVPKKVEQLLVAGRCISATHEAQGSSRTSPACMALGQAAGTAAALSIQEETNPRLLNPDLLRQTLLSQGVYI
jgi:hypothetical protein